MAGEQQLGSAVLILKSDGSILSQGLLQARENTERFTEGSKSSLSSLKDSWLEIWAKVQLVEQAVRAVADVAKSLVDPFIEQENASVKLAAVLRATGDAAGISADQMEKLGASIADSTGIDKDNIINAEAMLASYTSIGKDVFPQAMKAATDLSAIMGQDLSSSVRMMGRLLADPVGQMGALTRAGIIFTAQTKEQVKALEEAGQSEQAQNLILGQLRDRIGGVADAMGNTTSGALGKFNNAWKDLKASVGAVAATFIQSFGPEITDKLNGITKWFQDNQTRIVNFFARLPEVGGWAFATLKQVIGTLFTAAYWANFGESMWKFVLAAGKTTLDALVTIISDIGDALWQPLKVGFEWVVYGIKTAWQATVNFLVDRVNDLISPLNTLIKGLEGVVNDAISAYNFVSKLTGGAGNTAQVSFGSLQIAHPFGGSVAKPTDQVDLGRMQQDISDASSKAFDSVVDLAKDKFKLAADIAKPFEDTVKKALPGLMQILNQDLPAGVKKLGDAADAVARASGHAAPGNSPYSFAGFSTMENAGTAGAPGTGLSGFLSTIQRLNSSIAPAFDRLLGPVASLVGPLTSVMQLLNPLQTIFSAMMSVLGPAINNILAPLVGILKILGETIGQMLLPIVDALGPVLYLVGQGFVLVYNYAILPFANAIIFVGNLIYNGIAAVVNGIIAAINFLLGWAGVHINSLAYSPLNSGQLNPISMSTLSAAGGAGSSGSSGSGGGNASYQQAAPVYVTVNIDQPQLFGAGNASLAELATLIYQQLMLLGTVNQVAGGHA